MKSPEELQRDLRDAAVPKDAFRVLRASYAAHDAASSAFTARFAVRLDCHSGCSFCCHLRVGARAQEILLIADTIDHSWPRDKRDALLQRLRVAAERVRQLTAAQQVATNIQCPLLVDDKCSLYDHRPLGCRRHHSQDVSVCRDTYEDPTDVTTPGALHPEYSLGLESIQNTIRQLFQNAGYDSTDYELISGLLEALSSEKPLRRWWKRKKVFGWTQPE